VVLCEHLADAADADTIADRIVDVATDLAREGPPCNLSVGVAIAEDHHDAASLVHDADRAMYRAKWFRTGRGPLRLVEESDARLDLSELHDSSGGGDGSEARPVDGGLSLRIT
jgi:hypothetical protein